MMEEWLAKNIDDSLLADAMEEADRPILADRLRKQEKHKGKTKERIRRKLIKDIISIMPCMRVRSYQRKIKPK